VYYRVSNILTNTPKGHMFFRQRLSQFWTNVQLTLFPLMETRCGELSAKYKKLISILELIRIEEFIPCTKFNLGRPSQDRVAIARAYVAKMILKYSHTKSFLERLKTDKQLKLICGWEGDAPIPSESKFSRVFQEFTNYSLPEKVHQVLIKGVYKDTIVGHLVKDSVPIEAREKPLKKKSLIERKQIKNKRQKEERKGALNRRQKQLIQGLEKSLDELPKACDIGRKRSAKGCGFSWKGYKLHAAVDDHCIPISVLLTSASLNDCDAAIPLGKKAEKLVTNLYDLMDAAYDMKEIKEHSLSMGHIPIIDPWNKSKAEKEENILLRKKEKLLNFRTAERKRYKKRFPKERFNALFKDWFGGRNILYRGHAKISCHIMFGILSMTSLMLIKLIQ
jgi:hypothetical protein